MDGVADARVESLGAGRTGRRQAPDHLGRLADTPTRIAGVHALGAEGEEGVHSEGPSCGLEHRGEDLSCRAWPGRGLEDHERTGGELVKRRSRRRDDIVEVRFTMLAQGRRDADEDRLAGSQAARVRARSQGSRVHVSGQRRGWHILDVGPARGDLGDLVG